MYYPRYFLTLFLPLFVLACHTLTASSENNGYLSNSSTKSTSTCCHSSKTENDIPVSKQKLFFRAVASGNLKKVKQLSQSPDVNMNAFDCMSVPALTYAIQQGHTGVALHLIKRGANINYYDAHGLTPLHHAILHKNIQVVKELLYNGANYCALTKTSPQYTALQIARTKKIHIIQNILLCIFLTNEDGE